MSKLDGHQGRAEFIEAVERELWKLDAEPLYAIALIAGFDVETVRELGGL